jgi:hypothetical protein
MLKAREDDGQNNDAFDLEDVVLPDVLKMSVFGY